ncbi:glycosyltransferase [Aurantiacibacter flavus]|uniref:Glycosyltransferase n=1 Tax=Aurantiacibacter flavus TaxID=3145232 RepID=A0ABV0D281_9SPHN
MSEAGRASGPDSIMHVVTDFSSAEGAQTMLARLLRLSRGRKRVVVVSLRGVSERTRALADNPDVIYHSLGMTSPLHMPRVLAKLAALVRAERPDVLLCWMYHAMALGAMAGRLTGTPTYWTVRQSLEDRGALTQSTRAALWACRLLSRWPRGVMYNSSRSQALHLDYGYDNPNSIMIPNGFDLPGIAAPVPPATARVFGIAGRLHPQKDHPNFFKAAALAGRDYPHVRFCVAGKGMTSDNPEVQSMMEAAGARPEQFELLGELSDMTAFYQRIDALVLSSRTEGFPNVVAEAMSYGRPVVTTDVGDAADIVGDTGVVCPPRDPEALAAGIAYFAGASADDYCDKAQSALRRIEEKYSLPRIFKDYHNFLET